MSIVEIPLDLQQFVQAAVTSGAFQSESEVVAEGLRLLQRREQLGDLCRTRRGLILSKNVPFNLHS